MVIISPPQFQIILGAMAKLERNFI
jgi:hypothetical protein